MHAFGHGLGHGRDMTVERVIHDQHVHTSVLRYLGYGFLIPHHLLPRQAKDKAADALVLPGGRISPN